ncbi:MAG: iron-sulfur cluster assembly protein [Microbacter sp.]
MNLTIKEVVDVLQKVEHPAISLSLIDLGILTDIELIDREVVVVFAFPFPNIPIADQLIQSVNDAVTPLGLSLKYDIRTMNQDEKERFLTLEAGAWKG